MSIVNNTCRQLFSSTSAFVFHFIIALLVKRCNFDTILEKKKERCFVKTDKNIKVITAKNSGFCFGVKRAVNLAEKAVELGSNTYTLGPIIHNPQEVNRLEK
jgi:hypothetical protein